MPEGDTVYLAGRNLNSALAGHALTVSDFRVPRYATLDLVGLTVTAVVSRGKHLLTRFDDGRTLHTHFRMDGSWHLYRPGTPWHGGPMWQVRAVLGTEDWRAVGYRLPVIELLPTADEHTVVGHLGPDLLGPDWDADEAVRRIQAAPARAIGAALLDQRNLAGLGNLYRTEVCFLSGLSPWVPVSEVPDLRAVVERGHALLQANKDRSMQTTTGEGRRDRDHWVFERSRCLRCGSRVSTALQDSDGSVVEPHTFARAGSTMVAGPRRPADPTSPSARAGAGAGSRRPRDPGLGAIAGSGESIRTAGDAGSGAGTGRERVTYWCPRCQPGAAPASYPVRVLLGDRTVGRTRYAP